MSSIYRKYRPTSFNEMVGQNHIKLTLQNELENNSFVHAYLFSGPRGLGKTTSARLFAKAVNCEKRKEGESEPCNNCHSCNEFNSSKSIDLVEMDAASSTGVENVRENIIENVRFSPNKSKFKVFIIDEVHMLSISAFNALLKTLEEPPAHAIFILCTTELHKIPETIVSRCQRFDFKKISSSEAIKRLKMISRKEKIKIDDEVFEIIASKSGGCMRDAESLLGQVFSLGGDNITKEQVSLVLPTSGISLIIEFVFLLVNNRIAEAIEFVNKLVEEGVDLEVFNKDLIEFLRKLVLFKLGAIKSEWFGIDKKSYAVIDQIINLVSVDQLAKMIQIFLIVVVELKNSEIIQLPLELAIIKICENDTTNERAVHISPSPVDGGNEVSSDIINFKNLKKSTEEGAVGEEKKESNKREEKVDSLNIDLDKIKKEWNKIISESHKVNSDLMFIDRNMVWPVGLDGGMLEIGFQYDIHKDRFEVNGNKDIFEKIIEEVVGKGVKVKAKMLKPSELSEVQMEEEAIVNGKQEVSGVKVSEENILEQVLGSFGGEIIEEE